MSESQFFFWLIGEETSLWILSEALETPVIWPLPVVSKLQTLAFLSWHKFSLLRPSTCFDPLTWTILPLVLGIVASCHSGHSPNNRLSVASTYHLFKSSHPKGQEEKQETNSPCPWGSQCIDWETRRAPSVSVDLEDHRLTW